MKISNNIRNVAENRHQTDANRVLCVCSAGVLRSPTMANVLHQEFGFNTRAAGIEVAFALIPVTYQLVYWANEIVCASMENEKMIAELYADLVKDRNLINLGIPDIYDWNDPELRGSIASAYRSALMRL